MTRNHPAIQTRERRGPLFSTRDVLLMAALAALGGVTSTYLNTLGDAVQSVLGFAGSTQWAAGLHVLWLTLAVGLVGKPGVGTLTGILKGAVELLSGNTHGLLVVLVDVVAGVFVDLGFLPFRRRDGAAAYALAGGLGSASNVAVFQLFAALPADILSYGAIALISSVAFFSGVIFAGLLAQALLAALRRAGVVKNQPHTPVSRRTSRLVLGAAVLLAIGLTLYLRFALRGPTAIHIGGAVASAYAYPTTHGKLSTVTAESTLRGASARYTGVPVRDLLAQAGPAPEATMVLVRATDGYAFFISMAEVESNPNLLLAPQGRGQATSYSIVGAENSKAWVRNVSELIVIRSRTLPITGRLGNARAYDPNEWQFEMDSAPIDLGSGARKLQGAPLGKVLASMQPSAEATRVLVQTPEGDVALSLSEVLADDTVRLFTVIGTADVSFAVAKLDGKVVAAVVTGIEVQ